MSSAPFTPSVMCEKARSSSSASTRSVVMPVRWDRAAIAAFMERATTGFDRFSARRRRVHRTGSP